MLDRSASLLAAFGAEFDRLISTHKFTRIIVAFSGGADSTALLSATKKYVAARRLDALAVHVDHGLVTGSNDWATHCEKIAASIKIDYKLVQINEGPPSGESVEAWARESRYACFRKVMVAGDVLVTAHHADDQAETLMMRLMDGAGPHGLAGIRRLSRFGAGYLYRPLLACRRSDLDAYVRAENLEFVRDPMNSDPRFLRGRIRAQVMPVLDKQHPRVAENLSRSAQIQAEVAEYLDHQCDAIIAAENLPDGEIRVSSLNQLPELLRKMLIRYLAVRAGLDVPGERHLDQIKTQLCGPDYSPGARVSWGNNEFRRYRDILHAMKNSRRTPASGILEYELGQAVDCGCGQIELKKQMGPGLDLAAHRERTITIRFRRGGERCRPHGRGGSHRLKKLFQEWGVPPWQRPFVPLIYFDDEIAAVGDYCICDPFVASGRDTYRVSWLRPTKLDA